MWEIADILKISKSIKLLVKIKTVFLKKILLIYFQRGREGEREGEKHQCTVASHASPTGYLACNPGMRSNWELN